jgi:hypothetical protein
VIGFVVGNPYLLTPNPTYRRPGMDFFTVLLKGTFVEHLVETLSGIGYETKYPNTLSLQKLLPRDYEEPFL